VVLTRALPLLLEDALTRNGKIMDASRAGSDVPGILSYVPKAKLTTGLVGAAIVLL